MPKFSKIVVCLLISATLVLPGFQFAEAAEAPGQEPADLAQQPEPPQDDGFLEEPSGDNVEGTGNGDDAPSSGTNESNQPSDEADATPDGMGGADIDQDDDATESVPTEDDAAAFSVESRAASNPSGINIITNRQSKKPLDIANGDTSNYANVQQYANNNSPAQRFRLESAGAGYYYIVNVMSGKALDVANGAKKSGTNVWQYALNKSDAQKWMLVPVEGAEGYYYIVSALSGSGASLKESLVLDINGGSSANGANVQVYAYNGSQAQQFSLGQITQTVSNGVYQLRSGLSSSRVLDISGASVSNGGNAQIYASNGTAAQKFSISYDSNSGYYTLRNVCSGLVLDVAAASTSNGANVQQYASNGTAAQKWSIESNGLGAYTIRSGCSGLALDVSGGISSNGTNVQVWGSNNSAAQSWTFVSVKMVEEGSYEIQSARGTVLDAVSGGESAGTNVQAYKANNSLAQKYYFYYVGDGYYKIEAMKSGLVVDLDNGSGANVCLGEYSGSPSQLWTPSIAGGGYFYFTNKATGKVLDIYGGSAASGANVQVYSVNYSAAQKWALTPTDVVSEGMYAFQSALGSKLMLDVVSGSASNGASLQLYEDNGTPAQTFRVTSLGNGLHRISCLGSSKSLDVAEGAIAASDGSGTVQQWEGNQNTAQKWRFAYAGGGYVTVFSACGNGGSCLDVYGAQASNGARVQVYRSNGTLAQKFKLKESSSVTYVPYSISLSSMVSYQRANPYVSTVSDVALRAALDPGSSPGSAFYQFSDLRVNSGLSGSQLDAYINTNGRGGVLAGKGSAFAAAASKYKLNEAYFVAHTCVESGWGKSALARGAYYDGKGYTYTGKDGKSYWASLPGYKAGNYYNLFGIGAYDSDPSKYGIETAIKNGWNSVDAAIDGSAKWIASNYVYSSSYPQVTLYDMKWDVARSNATKAYGWHQYATDVQWSKTIARLMGECYSAAGVTSPNVVYRVPSYA